MSNLSAEDQAKLAALEGLIRAGGRAVLNSGGVEEWEGVQVAELVRVDWPQPDGVVYYASTCADDVWPGLRAKLDGAPVEPRLPGERFLDLMRDSGISDDSVSLELWDADRAISDLFETHGEGVRVEIFFYFPQVDLLLSQWFGHLRPPEEADEETFVARAENGFLSVMLPLPRRAFFNTCQAVFGGLLNTQAEIDEHDCPWNLHIGGDIGVPGSELLPTCPRNKRAECAARLGDDRFFLAFDTIARSYPVGSRGVIATSRGNENNLKRPLRVIAGERTLAELDLLASVVEVGNPSHPERGSIKLQHAISEGVIQSATQLKANNVPIQFPHWGYRAGYKGQPGTGFTPGANNYSGTAILQTVLQGDFRSTEPSTIQMELKVTGKNDVRLYTGETTFTEEYTRSRAWWLLEAYRNKRWGLGADLSRFWIEGDIIPLDEWFSQTVSFTDKDGNTYTGQRTSFDAELVDRTAQQQINDICLAGRCTVPFPYEGKLRVFPLKKLSADELAAAPVFTDCDDFGFDRNIIRDEFTNKSSLTRSSVSDRELPNAIKVTFDDAEHNHAEHPLMFDSVEQQLLCGRAYGDSGRRAVEKPYGLLGVTTIGEASRLGVLLRDLGEFDEGGLENNQRVRFQTFFTQTLSLYKSKVIRVLSKQLVNRRTGVQKFEYFRVRSIRKLSNLLVEVSAQAYPVEYYERTESLETPIGVGGGTVNTTPRGARPHTISFKTIETTNDEIILSIGRA